MSYTIRQICLVADKLQPVIEDFTHVFGLQKCYTDPQVEYFGLENALLPVGTDFIEIVSPIKDNTTASRYLERRHGNGGYMVILQADSEDLQISSLARSEKMGIRIAFQHTINTYHFAQLHPVDTGGSFLQIDWDSKNEHTGYWSNAGGYGWKEYIKKDVVSGMRAVEIQTEKPDILSQRWSDILNVLLVRNKKGHFELALNNGTIRFVSLQDERGEGLSAIDLTVTNREKLLTSADNRGLKISESQVQICGTRFNL
jgi:hypothetical protein